MSEVVNVAQYVVNFYNEVMTLKEVAANYGTMFTGSDLSESETAQVQEYELNVRKFVRLAFISYEAICLSTKKKVNPALRESYNAIVKKKVPELEAVDRFVLLLNVEILEAGIKQLYESSAQIISQIYGQNKTA